MNDPKELFIELFCNPSNKEMATLYLASLMSETENEKDYYKKERQLSLLRDFFEGSQGPSREYYLQKLREIRSIIEHECVSNGWNMVSNGDGYQ